MNDFKPMLAERQSVHEWVPKLVFPFYASFKLDGIRCSIVDGKAVSRSLKPFPNQHIMKALSWPEFTGLDGEIIVGDPNAEDAFRRTMSTVTTKTDEPCNFTYYVFDTFLARTLPYCERLDLLAQRVRDIRRSYPAFNLQLVDSQMYNNWEAIEGFEQTALSLGYEGLILRSPLSTYKFGRSTAREQGMLKLKRFVDDEAEIIGFEELMRNENEAYTDELGHTKRSSAMDGLVPGGTLGAFTVRNAQGDFNVGMFKGLTAYDKQEIWNNREKYLGKIIKFSYFPVGVKEVPRHPKFMGFRDSIDL
jgi:DNA ligase-1